MVLRRGLEARASSERRGVARRGDARGERPAFEGAGPVGSRGSALGPGSVMTRFFDRHGFSAHLVTSFSHLPATAAGAIPEQFGTSVSTRQPVAPRGRAEKSTRARRVTAGAAAAKPGCWRARAAPRRLLRCATAPPQRPPSPRAGATRKNPTAKKKQSRRCPPPRRASPSPCASAPSTA